MNFILTVVIFNCLLLCSVCEDKALNECKKESNDVFDEICVETKRGWRQFPIEFSKADHMALKSFEIAGPRELKRDGQACYTIRKDKDGKSSDYINSMMILRNVTSMLKFSCKGKVMGLKVRLSGDAVVKIDELRTQIGMDGKPQIVELDIVDHTPWRFDTFNLKTYGRVGKNECKEYLREQLDSEGNNILLEHIRQNVNKVISKKR